MNKGCKYLITATIDKIRLNIAFPVEIVVLWKRGHNKIETQKKSLNINGFETNINEELSMQACFQYQNNEKSVMEKKTSFSLILLTPKAKKIAGIVNLNLSDYINRQIFGTL